MNGRGRPLPVGEEAGEGNCEEGNCETEPQPRPPVVLRCRIIAKSPDSDYSRLELVWPGKRTEVERVNDVRRPTRRGVGALLLMRAATFLACRARNASNQ